MFKAILKWVNTNNLVLIIITIYFLISIIKLEHPGVHNDQLMFVNTATFHPDNPFLWKSYKGFPMMIFPYIGALKAYLYMPIFYFFGVNIWSIRLPHIILMAISLFLLYKSINLSFNKYIALITVAFLGLDPSNIVYTRIDTGPTVIEFFLKVLTIYLFILYLKTKNIFIFLSIYLVLALGIFNKINFIWFVTAFLLSFLIVYGKRFYQDFKHLGRIVPLLLIVVPGYFIARLFIKLSRETALSYKNFSNEVSVLNIYENFPSFFKNLSDLISGNILFNKIYGYDPTIFGGVYVIFTYLMLILGAFFIFIKFRTFPFLKPLSFILSITLMIILQILLTKRALAAWHIMVISPFFTILFAVGIYQIIKILKFQKIFFIFIIFLMILYQLAVNFIYINQYSKPTKSVAYSSAIYNLIDYVKFEDKKFICVDIDICNQLISLTQQKGKYSEPFFFLDPPTYEYSMMKLTGNFFKSDENLYIFHADENSHAPLLKTFFFKFIREREMNVQKIKEFNDGEKTIFEIFKVGYY